MVTRQQHGVLGDHRDLAAEVAELVIARRNTAALLVQQYVAWQKAEDKLKALQIDSGNGCVAPSAQSAQDGSYFLSRPLYVYPSDQALQNETVDSFLQFYLDNINAIAEQIGFIPMTDQQLQESQSKLESLTSGGGGGTTTG